MSRFVLLTEDTAFEHRVRAAIAGGLSGSLRALGSAIPDSPLEILAASDAEPVEVLLLGPSVAQDEAFRMASIIDVQRPDISVVLVADATPETAIAAMRAGIRDILDPAANPDEIRVLVERASRASANRVKTPAPHGATSSGRILVVASSKGGVGKTTLATNLALALGRVAPMSTVLVDLDAQFGDVASALRLEPEHTLVDAVSGAAKQDSMVLKTFLSVHPSSIYALCAPSSPADADSVTGEDVAHLLDQLASEFEYVVVDTAPGLGERALAALEAATDGIFTCSMDVPSVRGLRKELDVAAQLGLAAQRHVVLNMGDPKNGLSLRDVEATLGTRVDIVVPRSREVALSTNTGEPLLQKTKRGRAAKSLDRLAARFDPARAAESRRGRHGLEVVK
ncbi:AAA family ATPase [Paramicrobacterium agarici]|uniref:AAA family ATPase n=1 Tax=Paramicrobacterium agarici TaxID=630514 RepID=UPI001150BF61|nr:AAA family ATPase [Microbacterium agarici]TQO22564.1 pilus assembly protein CpaE [Microbacterium agarici]